MWDIEWAGEHFTGESADDVLDAIAAAQWGPTPNIRRAISDRIWNADRIIVDDELPADQFLRRLDQLGFVRIVTAS